METMSIITSPMTAAHWADVAQIYQDGINTGQATFAVAPPASWDEWCRGKINPCSLIAQDANHHEITGWAALSPVSSRAVYAGVAEVSIYVSTSARGQGVGSVLLQELIHLSELHGIWTLQAGIFPENRASLQLHLRQGFRAVGLREKLGRMELGEFKGKWRDVMLLERRSQVVGR
jgi:L-amino acid N-acyltransferase YncA